MKVSSNLEKILASGQFAATGELGPPKSAEAEAIKRKAALLKGLVDAVNITDNQTAIVRMSSIAVGIMLLQEGIEPTIQMTCRDRNRLAIQADLLGASALGVKNLLNGPCGGSQRGKCEVNPETDCAWQLIYDRLKALGQLDRLAEPAPLADWSKSHEGGARKIVREDQPIAK